MDVKKIRKTLFWGVKLDPQSVFCNDEIKDILRNYPNVTALKHLHVTLLYVGRKTDPNEDLFMPFKYKICKLYAIQ